MPELLLELFTEEIPARMQARAAEDLARLAGEKLKAAGLAASKLESYVTPRRLVLVAEGVPAAQADQSEERRGPRVGAPPQAVEGFLKSAGIASLDECEQRDTGKGVFYFAVIKRTGKPTPPSACWICCASPNPRTPLAEVDAISGSPIPLGAATAERYLHLRRQAYQTATFQFPLDGAPVGDTTRGHRFLRRSPSR